MSELLSISPAVIIILVGVYSIEGGGIASGVGKITAINTKIGKVGEFCGKYKTLVIENRKSVENATVLMNSLKEQIKQGLGSKSDNFETFVNCTLQVLSATLLPETCKKELNSRYKKIQCSVNLPTKYIEGEEGFADTHCFTFPSLI
ncbi:unnamed protein product [Heterobilharzia americana]|nr:unnamed protein product [Heterobilharzia americana]